METPDRLIVATTFDWVWRDLAAGVGGRWPVVRDRGHTVPDPGPGTTAWWTPTAHAARLVHAGLDLSLACVPAGWVAGLDPALTVRRVHAATLSDLLAHAGELPESGFAKPALAKLDALPAGWHDDLPGRLAAAAAAGVHPDTPVEWSLDRLDLAAEYRTYVVDGQVIIPSPYRIAGQGWEPEFDARTDVQLDIAHAYAAEVAAGLHAAGHVPSAWVLDVAVTTAGTWLVVEANAAWSAGTYGCDLTAVADACVTASTGPVPEAFRWRPDPSEAAAAAARPLPRR